MLKLIPALCLGCAFATGADYTIGFLNDPQNLFILFILPEQDEHCLLMGPFTLNASESEFNLRAE